MEAGSFVSFELPIGIDHPNTLSRVDEIYPALSIDGDARTGVPQRKGD
jgi:hypothetical protein